MKRRAILPADVVEWNGDRAGQPYEPASYAEGEKFRAAWCADCRRQGQGDSPIRCPVLFALEFNSIGDELYPAELQYGRDGQPGCTAFRDRHGPHRRWRCRRTLDLFPSRYYNHQTRML